MWHPKKRSVEGVGEKVNVALHIVRGWQQIGGQTVGVCGAHEKGCIVDDDDDAVT